MRLKTSIPELGDPKTYLTAPAATGATALTVANNAEFSANDYVIIGKPGQEGTELHKIATLTGNGVINVDALKFGIAVNTPIYYIKYNQVKFLMGDWSTRYHTGTISATKNSAVITGVGVNWATIDVTYALLLNGKWYDLKSVDSATQITLTTKYLDDDISLNVYDLVAFAAQNGSTVDISADQLETIWDDTDSLAEDYYRSQYYNSTSTILSGYSSIIAAAETEGYSEFARKTIEDQVLSDLRDKGATRRTRDEIDTDINDAIRELVNAIVAEVLDDYLSSYNTIDFKASRSEYPLFDDFRKMSSIWISDGSEYHKASPMRISDDLPNVDWSVYDPRYYLRDNVIGIRPVPTSNITAGAKIWYERRIPSLNRDGDELPYLLRDWKRTVVAYCLQKGSEDKNQIAIYGMEFAQDKQNMIDTLSDRDPSTNKSVEIVNDGDLFT